MGSEYDNPLDRTEAREALARAMKKPLAERTEFDLHSDRKYLSGRAKHLRLTVADQLQAIRSIEERIAVINNEINRRRNP